jgi:actin-related protein 9
MGPFFAVLLGRYVVQNPEQHTNEVQPKSVRTLKIPDFYSEYREKGEGYAAFLGSSIIAKVGPPTNYLSRHFSDDGCTFFSKVTFHESQNKSFVNKAEYGESGPSAIIGMSPALL